MNGWSVANGQWVAWIELGVSESSPAYHAIDELDFQIAEQLARRPFVVGPTQETVNQAIVSEGSDRSEPIETRDWSQAADDPSPPGPALDVGLDDPAHGFEVSLHPPSDGSEAPPSRVVAPGGTVVAYAPSAPPSDELDEPTEPIGSRESLVIDTQTLFSPDPEPPTRTTPPAPSVPVDVVMPRPDMEFPNKSSSVSEALSPPVGRFDPPAARQGSIPKPRPPVKWPEGIDPETFVNPFASPTALTPPSSAPGPSGVPGGSTVPGPSGVPGGSGIPGGPTVPGPSGVPGGSGIPGGPTVPGPLGMPGGPTVPGSSGVPRPSGMRSDEDRPAVSDPVAPLDARGPSEPPTPTGPAPSADADDDDGLFIPTLTRPSASSTAVAVSEPPRSEPLPPIISGDTVIGPPPSPPAGDDESPSSGVITGRIEPADDVLLVPDQGVGEGDQVDAQAPPRTSKVVVDPSASGIFNEKFERELDDEPHELDADDLVEAIVEETIEVTVAEEVSVEFPETRPASVAGPHGPPPAPDVEPRRSLDLPPPPRSVPHARLEKAMAALTAAPMVDEHWQIDVFAEHYGALMAPQRAPMVASEADFILECTGLSPGATMLDIGCGDGAHCLAMAARGLTVTGLDPSPTQLTRAGHNAQAMGVDINFVSGDMRRPAVEGPFDVITCLGGTLGMFDDQSDRVALEHMHAMLAPGGRLVLHLLNRDYIVGRLPARSWWQGKGCLVLDEAELYSPTSRLHVHRTIVFETGQQFEHNIGLRVYGLSELVQMCAQAGLEILEYSGSRHTRGCFYGATSTEIWLVAQRPIR